jgi:hypothetical protein
MSTKLFPKAMWLSGTNQNSVPANDNSLRDQVLNAYFISNSTTAQPGSPVEGDAYIIAATHTGAAWATLTPNDLAIFTSGSWYAFAPTKGLVVNLAGVGYQYSGTAWVALTVTPAPSAPLPNLLINGGFQINQKSVSGTVTLAAGVYGHDGWKAGASGCTYTFAASGGITTLTITAGSLQQVIEGANLRTGTHALSWVGTAQGKVGAGSYGATGVTGSLTGGTNGTIEFNTGTLSDACLVPGSLPQAYVFNGLVNELRRCQRYCWRPAVAGGGTSIAFMLTGSYATSTLGYANGQPPVPLYAYPALVIEGGAASAFQLYSPNGQSNRVCSAIALNVVTTPEFIVLDVTTSTGGTAGNLVYLDTNAQTTNSLRFEARL